ncbi:MAG: hypothetical protein VX410_06450, partial [Actinomycetota bacterium]|nr:hypothetical protein [Actinomycetota bacterium]
ICRALVQETFLLEAARKPSEDFSAFASEAMRAVSWVAAIATVAGIFLVSFQLPLSNSLGVVLLCMTGLLWIDMVRYLGFAKKRGSLAIRADGSWLLLATLSTPFAAELWQVVLAWAGSALVGGFIAFPAMRSTIRPTLGALQWFTRYRQSGAFLATDFVVTQLVRQAVIWMLATGGSFSQAGIYRAGEVLVAPVTLVMSALMVAATANLASCPRAVLVRRAAAYSVIGIACGAGWAFCLILVPSVVGRTIISNLWPDAQLPAVALSLVIAVAAVSRPSLLILRITGCFRRGILARVAMLPISVLLCGYGAHQGGAFGAAAGLFAATVFVSAVLTYQAYAALRSTSPAEGD